jgi:hypothetical protein
MSIFFTQQVSKIIENMKKLHNAVRLGRWIIFGIVLVLFTTIIGGFLGMIVLGAVDIILSIIIAFACYRTWKPLINHLSIYWFGAVVVILGLFFYAENSRIVQEEVVFVTFPFLAMGLSAYLGWMTEKLKTAGMQKQMSDEVELENELQHETVD